MIPTAFIPVPQMPLTTSGKTDRKTLREQASSLSIQVFTASGSLSRCEPEHPSTEIEFQIQRLVADVLGLSAEEIGMQDNFFELGGDSVKAMLMSTKGRRLGLAIKVAAVFDCWSLRDLAVAVDESLNT